jgi:hypothetical protein
MKLNCIHQLLVCTDDVNLQSESIHTLYGIEALLVTSKETGLEANAEQTISSCFLNRRQDKITA